MLLRFFRPEFVSQCFGRRHTLVVYHFHKRLLVMSLGSCPYFFLSANASSVASAVAPTSITAICYNEHIFSIHINRAKRKLCLFDIKQVRTLTYI